MALRPFVKDGLETLLFASDLVALGSFRCDVSDPRFHDSGAVRDDVVVFPRRIVKIQLHRGSSFVADPTTVPLYSRGQRYTRVSMGSADHADWVVVASDVFGAELKSAVASSDHATFLAQRQIFDALTAGQHLDALRVEETMLDVVASVLRRPCVTPRRADAEVVAKVKKIIAGDLARNHSLRALAAAAEIDPFRLCRVFKSVAGVTLNQYRHALRLRVAVSRVRRERDLASLAAKLGYASHSHFTAVFRRHFGVTPSDLRRITPCT